MSNPAAAHLPPSIAPRSLQKLIATWDAEKENEVLMLSVREALNTLIFHAKRELSVAHETLFGILSQTGNTRRKSSVLNLREAIASGTAVEAVIEKWEFLERRCRSLLSEIDDHAGLFSEEDTNYLKQLVLEVSTAPWELGGAPHANPWDSVPSAFSNRKAHQSTEADVSRGLVGRSGFTVAEFSHYNTAQMGSQHASTPQKLNVSCVGMDNLQTSLTTVYIGTMNGCVISFPVDMFTQGDGTLSEATGETLQQLLRIRSEAVRSSSIDLSKLSPTSNGIRVFQGHQYPVLSIEIVSFGTESPSSNCIPDETALPKLVISTAQDKVVRVSNSQTGALVGIYSSGTSVVPSVQYFPMLNCILQGNFHGTIEAWDYHTSTSLGTILQLRQPITCLYVVATHVRSTRIFIGTRRGHIYSANVNVVEIDTGNDNIKRRFDHNKEITLEFGFLGDPSAPLPEELSPSPQQHADDAAPFSMTLADTSAIMEENDANNDVKLKIVLGGHQSAIAAMTSIGSFLFSADVSGKVVQWDTERRIYIRKYHAHTDTVTGVIISGDGIMFTSSLDGLVCIWNISNGALLKKISRHFNVVAGIVLGYKIIKPAAASKAAVGQLNEALLSVKATSHCLFPGAVAISPQSTKKVQKGPPSPVAAVPQVIAVPKDTRAKIPPKAVIPKTTVGFPIVPFSHRRALGNSRDCISIEDGNAMLISFSRDESIICWNLSFDKETQ